MAIHLVRHGRTAANAGGLLLGRLDPELDELGARQAEAAAARLATSLGSAPGRPVRVVSSPLARCRSTAAVVAQALGVEVELDERWIELDYGELDGTPMSEISAETWAAWRADMTWRPRGGETLAEVGARVRAACDDVVRTGEAADGDVVVVTHVSPLKAAVAWALGVGDDVTWRLYVAPGSISRISLRGTATSLQLFNATSEL